MKIIQRKSILTIAAVLTAVYLQTGIAVAQSSAASDWFNKLTQTLSDAKTIEYTSTISTFDGKGPITFYIHTKLLKPHSFWMSVARSESAEKPPVIYSNDTGFYEYDPARNLFQVLSPMSTKGLSGHDMLHVAAAMVTPFQLLASHPFAQIMTTNTQGALKLTRRDTGIDNAMLLVATLDDSIDQKKLARMWVDGDKNTPDRLAYTLRQDGVDHDSFREDFKTFDIDPELNDSDFVWHSPEGAKPYVSSTDPSTASGGSSVIKIRVGGPGLAGTGWKADMGYSTGEVDTRVLTDPIDTSLVTNPAPEAVYKGSRCAPRMNYTISYLAPNTPYQVRLHFCETYWNSPGERVFNVGINNQIVLQNFDILSAAGGAYRAVAKQFDASSDSSGRIVISFAASVDNALVNGIEILKAGDQ